MGLFQNGPDVWDSWARGMWGAAQSGSPQQGNTAVMGSPGAGAQIAGDAGTAGLQTLGFIPKQVDPNAPGAQLDTSNADEERARLAPLLAMLQQQAATGGGSWENTLRAGTESAQASAQALGQSMPGQGYASALGNIGTARAGVAQQSAGQANILRAKAKQGAEDQLGTLLGSEGDTDANQAAAQQAARQGAHDLQNSLNAQASKNFEGATGAIGNAFSSKMSDGGPVPGRPQVFGDDSRNDTVPAMLSPGEIVIPRSHAGSPESAAAFVAALQRSRGVQHFAGGGSPDDGSGLSNGGANAGTTALQVFLPHVGQAVANSQNNSPQAPSIENGGLLDTGGYDANREATLRNSNFLMGRAIGQGPSVAAQQNLNATDANIAAAMLGSRGAGAADVLGRAVTANQGAAGAAAETRMGEQAGGVSAAMRALVDLRNRDNAFAQAQQQAAFRNTEVNAGLDLAQQEQLRGIFSGAGQAAVAGSQMGGARIDGNSNGANDSYASRGSASDLSAGDPDFKAHGGEVHAKSASARRPMTDAPRRDTGSVQVQALDPTMVTMGEPTITSRVPYPREMPAEDHDEFAVQRAQGGFISALRRSRGMAEGGGVGFPEPRTSPAQVFTFDPNQNQVVPLAPPAPSFTGAELGLGSVPPGASFSLPSPEPLGAPLPAGMKLAPRPEKTLEATGEKSPDGQPVARPVDAVVERPLPVRPGWGDAPAAKPAVQASGQPAATGGPLPGAADEAEAARQSNAAADAGYQAEVAQSKAKLDATESQHKLIEDQLIERRRRDDAAHAEGLAAMSKVQAAIDDAKSIDTTVDPNRYWASRSTGQKISGIIGLVLGSLGARPDGINQAAVMMNQAIDRDVDAQKSEHAARIQKGQAAISAATSMYGLQRNLLGDDAAARSATDAAARELAAMKIDAAILSTQDPVQKAKLLAFKAQTLAGVAKNKEDVALKVADLSIKRMNADSERIKANAVAAKGGGGKPNGGSVALNRFADAWREGGGFSGALTKYIPGSAAMSVDAQRDAVATSIAAEYSAGKAPRPALIEIVKRGLPAPGTSQAQGDAQIRALGQTLEGLRSTGDDAEPE